MKNINNFITEAVEFTNDYFSIMDGKKIQYEYAIVFPDGNIEMFSEKTINDIISQDEDEWDDPDMYDTYLELSELPVDGKWYAISGPVGKGDLKDTLGIHYKK